MSPAAEERVEATRASSRVGKATAFSFISVVAAHRCRGGLTDWLGALTFHRHRLTPAVAAAADAAPCCKFFRISTHWKTTFNIITWAKGEKSWKTKQFVASCVRACLCVCVWVSVSHLLASQILFSFWPLSICVIFKPRCAYVEQYFNTL